jgi:hypothetical protein
MAYPPPLLAVYLGSKALILCVLDSCHVWNLDNSDCPLAVISLITANVIRLILGDCSIRMLCWVADKLSDMQVILSNR